MLKVRKKKTEHFFYEKAMFSCLVSIMYVDNF